MTERSKEDQILYRMREEIHKIVGRGHLPDYADLRPFLEEWGDSEYNRGLKEIRRLGVLEGLGIKEDHS